MREGFQGAAEAVVLCVVGGGLDAVAAADCGGEVGGVGFVGCEIDFAEESVGRVEMVVSREVRREGRRVGNHFCSWYLNLRTMMLRDRAVGRCWYMIIIVKFETPTWERGAKVVG